MASQQSWNSDASAQMNELAASVGRRESPLRAAQSRDENGQLREDIYSTEKIEQPIITSPPPPRNFKVGDIVIVDSATPSRADWKGYVCQIVDFSKKNQPREVVLRDTAADGDETFCVSETLLTHFVATPPPAQQIQALDEALANITVRFRPALPPGASAHPPNTHTHTHARRGSPTHPPPHPPR